MFFFCFVPQEESKIYSSARYLEKFFDEQLAKWLPQYSRKNPKTGNEAIPSKRTRLNDFLFFNDDDDVLPA